MTTAEPAPTLDFDPDALREKYRLERDKRLRGDGNNQYIEVVGVPPVFRMLITTVVFRPFPSSVLSLTV